MSFTRIFCSATFAVAFCLGTTLTHAQSPQSQTSEVTASDDMVVTLLGTGTPTLDPRRFGFSNLVQAGGLNLMFDAGRGASIRLGQLKLPIGKLDGVFLTHFHSDHTNGLADIFTAGYLGGVIGGRKEAMHLYGPPGVARIAEGLRATYLSDIETRIADENIPEPATRIDVTELAEGVILDKNGVKVTMFKVNHGEKIEPAVGYRIDYKGKSVVFGGDTKYDENVIRFAKGANLLVHEAGLAAEDAQDMPNVKRVLGHHTLPEDAGRVFDQARPGMAVYSHVVRMDLPNKVRPTMAEVIRRTRKTYSGPLIVGEDLMQFQIGEAATAVMIAGD